MTKKKTSTVARDPAIGDIVEVTWVDAAGYVNTLQSEAKLSIATNIGVLAELDDSMIKLRTGIYKDRASEDPMGDWTVIPAPWITEISVVARKRGKGEG